MTIDRLTPGSGLQAFPPPDRWDDWREYDTKAWPRKVEKRYLLVPTICFNCEAACGLLAYVDKDAMRVRKFEGNPLHPASRGHNCAKGPATINQIHDPERILYPLKRAGARGGGEWTRVTWDEVLDDIGAPHPAGRSWRTGATRSCTTSAGPATSARWTACCRPGASTATTRTPTSARRRRGWATRCGAGYDRPTPDHANARFILLLSSHLEAGHYFNPHAQRIIEGKLAGAKLAVMDPRLSNTASQADYWLPTYPGSEAAVLLAMARRDPGRGAGRPRLRRALDQLARVHGRPAPAAPRPPSRASWRPCSEHYARVHARVRGGRERRAAREDRRGGARDRRARAAPSPRTSGAARRPGNLGGWQVARALQLLTRAHRERRHARAARRRTPGTSTSPPSGRSRRRRRTGTSCCSRASGRSATTRCRSCCRTS